MNTEIKMGVIQASCSPDPQANFQHTVEQLKRLASQGAQVVCLQEMFRTQYFCHVEDHQHFALAEAIPGPTTESLQQLAAELELVIIASIFEKRTAGLYHNSLAVLDANGDYLGKYRKMHIPDDPGYYEKFYFTPGDLGYQVFSTKYAKIGTLICWDQWFPEAARITSMMGADILVFPTAIGWDQAQDTDTDSEQFEAWETIQRSHAIANGVHVVAVNRVGLEGNTKFWGGSMVINPMGRLLWQAGTEEVSAVIPIDLDHSDRYRTHWPFLRDRRIDSYDPLVKRFIDPS